MAKGLAVISGSSTVVFKALETGDIVLGAQKAANVVVSGSLKLTLEGAGADKFLVSDADGNATWAQIQASQVNTTGGDLQSVLDGLEASVGGDVDSLEVRLSQEESRAAAAEGSLQTAIDTAVANLVDGAPALLDTLNELAAALGDDENFATTIINKINADVSTEASIRLVADQSLAQEISSQLDAEASARSDSDQSLDTALSVEISTRAAADQSLESKISADVSAEASIRDAADQSLESKLSADMSAEVSARADADQSLTTRISAEESARGYADGVMQADLSTEVSARIAGDESLESALSTEIADREAAVSAELSRAESVEASLAARITSNGGDNLAAANSYTDSKVAALVDSAPEVLDTLNELAAALGDDPNFSTTILNAVGSVASNLSTEVSRAGSAEGSLDSKVSAETVRAESAEASLTARISAEESARGYADGQMQGEISAEVSRAQSAEASLASEISDLGDNQIIVQGTANEVEVAGGTVTLSAGGTITLGLPNDVVISDSLTVNGNVTLGVDGDDAVVVNGKFQAPKFTAATIPAAYTSGVQTGNNGHMFYLDADDDAVAAFPQGQKWYFCEDGVWHASSFYVGA